MSRVIIDIQGPTISTEELDRLSHPNTAGVILFSRNIQSFEQTRQLCEAIRQVNSQLLVCIDQEGGRVQRLKASIGPLPAMSQLGLLYDHDASEAIELARNTGWIMASEVAASGIDFSFAPVLDIDYKHSEIIGDRAFHHSIDALTTLASAFIQGMNETGMQATGKHFPGHGHVVADSHLELPRDNRPFKEIASHDLQSFNQLSPLLTGIMPAHIVYTEVDPMPAGFSTYWLKDVLRQQIGFDGIIFSDDLSMEGAAEIGDFMDRTHAAFTAGCDVVLVCNNPSKQQEVLDVAAQYETTSAFASYWPIFKLNDYPGLDELVQMNRYQTTKDALNHLMHRFE